MATSKINSLPNNPFINTPKDSSIPLKSTPASKVAIRQLSQSESGGRQYGKIVGKAANQLQTAPKISGKTLSTIRSCWDWTCRTRIVKWGVTSTLKMARFGLTCYSVPKSSKEENENDLNALTGSQHLTKLLQVLTQPLAKALQDVLVAENQDDDTQTFLFKSFLKEELPAINSLMKIMLPAISVHLARHVKESIYEETGQYPETVSLLDIICCLSDLVKNHLPHIAERIQTLENKTNSAKREQKILQLFIPLTDELLAILFPNGSSDLPVANLPLAPGYTWSLLRNQAVPAILMKVYQRLMQPFNLDDAEKLKAYIGGDSLVELAQTIGTQPGAFIPALLTGSATLSHVEKFIKGMCQNNTPMMKQWLSKWMANQVENISNSGRKEIHSIFNFCGGYVEPFLLHVFRCLATPPIEPEQAQGLFPNAMGMIAIKVLAIISNFMNVFEEQITTQWTQLKNTTSDPAEDPKLLELFKHLSDDLLRISGLDDYEMLPVPDFLQKIMGDNIQAALPKFLIQQYKAIQEGTIQDEEIRKKLRSFFFDEKKLKDVGTEVTKFLYGLGHVCKENMFDEFYQKLWEESGTDRIVHTLEEMCRVLSSDIVDSALSQLGVSSQNALKMDNNSFMRQATQYLKTLTETAVLRILTQALSTTTEFVPTSTEDHPRKFLATNVLMRLMESCGKGLKNIDEKLKEIDTAYSDNPTLHAVEKRKIFARLAEDLHAMSGQNPLSHLPFDGLPASDSLKDKVWETVKTTILPDALASQFDDLAEWDKQLANSFDNLEDCYHTSHPQWTCKVLAQYGTDFIRHYLATGGNDSANLILKSMQAYFIASSSEEGGVVNDLLAQQAEEIQAFLAGNLATLGDYQEAPMMELWPLLTRYLEGIIAKFLAGFSSTIKDIEANNPDFMVDIAINMLKDTADYFKIVNEIVKQHDEEHAYSINPINIITGFREHLHDGVPMDPTVADTEKDRIRLQGCFIPRAMNLLELAGISNKDFPVPRALRQPLGELIVGTLLPLVLLRADEKALGHDVRDALMLNFVQTLYSALNGIELIKEDEILEDHKPTTDPKQKRLNETCGSVVLELVKLIPDTMVQYVFMKEKVQNMSAEAIGEATMPHLSRWTLLQLIDTVMYVSLPGLHPAKWEGKVGREVLIPRKAFIKPNGKMALKPVRKFKFHFPRTPLEIQEARLKQMQFANKTKLQLRDGFTLIISNQLRIKLWEAVKTIWGQFQGQLDVLIERQFPDKGLEVKKFLDTLFHRIFFDFIGSIIQFLSIPVINGLEFLIQKVYIDTKSKEIIENLHSDALENLVYKWMDTLLDTLLKLKANSPARSE